MFNLARYQQWRVGAVMRIPMKENKKLSKIAEKHNSISDPMSWEKTSEKPLVDWNEDFTQWTQSNYCPAGTFLVGLYCNGNFDWFKVKLTEQGLVEVDVNDQEYPVSDYGLGIEDFEYWMRIDWPVKLTGFA